MKKLLLIATFACISSCLFAHGTRNICDSTQQFLLIIRYKPNMPKSSADALKANTQRWGQFIGQLAQSGKLVTGFRPGTHGKTFSGNAKTATDGVYAGDKEVVSSIFVIKAANMEEASDIAKKCPIYEFDGSVEIRPVIDAAN
jgi:hypothetical protein